MVAVFQGLSHFLIIVVLIKTPGEGVLLRMERHQYDERQNVSYSPVYVMQPTLSVSMLDSGMC
tara:strand:- start:159 stop:347 length:189 start_codon:yes stop_codon:yes gene_type:complete